MEVKMTQVESSNVRAFGYDAATSTLVVVFTNGGRYHYLRVPPEIFAKLEKANLAGDSIGKFIATRIRGYYTDQKVEAV